MTRTPNTQPMATEGVVEALKYISFLAVDFNSPIMSAWDEARARIIQGERGSLPRDILEAALSEVHEVAVEALATLASAPQAPSEKVVDDEGRDVTELAEDAFNEGWRSREARAGQILNSRSEMRRTWLESNAKGALDAALASTTPVEPEPVATPPLAGEVERLREALAPFAEAAATLSSRWDNQEAGWQGCLPRPLTVGHLRQARDALSPKQEG